MDNIWYWNPSLKLNDHSEPTKVERLKKPIDTTIYENICVF